MRSPNTSLPPLQRPSRRNGKIAKLPIEQRDTLNRMLADGATGTVIIDHFRSLKVDLNPTNITNWKEGGFEDWLRHQEALHELQNDGELAALLGTDADETAFHKGVLRLAMTKLFKALRTNQLEEDPVNYNRMLTNLARLSRESLALRKHLDGLSAPATQPGTLDPHRELTDDERNAILDKLDRVLGFTTKPTTPPASDLSSESTPQIPELKPTQGDLSQPSFPRSREREFAPSDAPTNGFVELPPAPEFTPKDDDIGFIGADAPVTSAEERNYLRSLCAPFDPEQTNAPELIPCSREGDFAPFDPQSQSASIPDAPAETTVPTTEAQPSESELVSSLDIRPSSLPESVVQNSAPYEIENLPRSTGSESALENVGENSSAPEIGIRKSAIENFVHPDLLTCHCCKAPLPPLLSNGERPDPFCPKCRSALRHPATLKFYCPKCRNSIRDLWFDDETRRSSDTCPTCLTDLPPVDLLNKSWPPKPTATTPPPAATEVAHAE